MPTCTRHRCPPAMCLAEDVSKVLFSSYNNDLTKFNEQQITSNIRYSPGCHVSAELRVLAPSAEQCPQPARAISPHAVPKERTAPLCDVRTSRFQVSRGGGHKPASHISLQQFQQRPSAAATSGQLVQSYRSCQSDRKSTSRIVLVAPHKHVLIFRATFK